MSKLSLTTRLLVSGLNKPLGHNSPQVRMNCHLSSKLFYSEFGDPVKVLTQIKSEIKNPGPDEVIIKMLAAPVNPADINTIQGKYPAKPVLPAVPGSEGVGKVVLVGSEVKDIEEGDHVVPLKNNLGTWQTHLVLPKDKLLKVPKKLDLVQAATLTVNPCTAFRMLRDFETLKPGDTVLQNGANSACGQNVIQICKSWGIRTVNVVRDRPNINELKKFLDGLGANYILTEEELRKTDLFKSGQVDKPKLVLNCVGGKNALECLRHLDSGGSMVTYGGMSREPVTVPTSALIFKNVKILGFWMSRWSIEHANSVDRFEMFSEIISMMTSNELQAPACTMVDFDNYKEAILNTLNIQGMIGKKFVLKFE